MHVNLYQISAYHGAIISGVSRRCCWELLDRKADITTHITLIISVFLRMDI